MKIPTLSVVLIAGLAITTIDAMEKNERARALSKEVAQLNALSQALKEGDFDRYFALIENEPDEFKKTLCSLHGDLEGNRAIHVAAMKGNLEAVKKLLCLESPINARTQEGMSPLLYAAKQGSVPF